MQLHKTITIGSVLISAHDGYVTYLSAKATSTVLDSNLVSGFCAVPRTGARVYIDSLVRSGRNLARAASSQHESDDPNFSISQQYTRFNDNKF